MFDVESWCVLIWRVLGVDVVVSILGVWKFDVEVES